MELRFLVFKANWQEWSLLDGIEILSCENLIHFILGFELLFLILL